MADYLSDAKMAGGNTDGGPYDQDLHHEYIIKEEEEDEEMKIEKEIKSEGGTVLYLMIILNKNWKFTLNKFELVRFFNQMNLIWIHKAERHKILI